MISVPDCTSTALLVAPRAYWELTPTVSVELFWMMFVPMKLLLFVWLPMVLFPH